MVEYISMALTCSLPALVPYFRISVIKNKKSRKIVYDDTVKYISMALMPLRGH
jgi:hypothetical protein